MQRKRRRRIAIACALAVLAAAAVAVSVLGKGDKPQPGVPAERTAAVISNTYTQVIDISGYVEPYDSQTLRFRSTGAVTGVMLGVNLVNALVIGILGVPGLGLLLLVQWLFAL